MMTPARLAALAAAFAVGAPMVHAADVVAISPDGLWSVLSALPAGAEDSASPFARPRTFKPAQLDLGRMTRALASAPAEFTAEARQNPLVLHLPMPDGTFQRFSVARTATMEPALQARFPHIQSFVGFGLDDAHASVRLDVSDHGLRAMVLTLSGPAYIEPFNLGDTGTYVVFDKTGYGMRAPLQCGVVSLPALRGGPARQPVGGEGDNYGSSLLNFRTAISTTGEYTVQAGGTVAAGLSFVNTTINRLTGIYERDLAVRLTLVGNNNLIIYTNPSTDPYTAPGANGTTLNQVQAACDTNIGTANYDVGHVLHRTTGGANGVAGAIGNACRTGFKAQGISVASGSQLLGDPFVVDYVAHELGHQFAGNHTFNNCGGGSGSANPNSVVEPGSGVTIMGYAGLCGINDLAPNSIETFHAFNLVSEMRPYVTTGLGNCGQVVATGNSIPTVNGGLDRTIPISTPFELTALATDANGDALSYQWEQNDPRTTGVGVVGGNFPDVGNNPIFRSFLPSTSPTRVFPRIPNLFNNTISFGETLPTTNRAINFLIAVRDNRGGYNTDAVRLTSTTSAGPFTVTTNNSPGTVWTGNTAQSVSWNVANTTIAPVNAASVMIQYTTNQGTTWTTIVPSTPNDGSELIVAPNINTTTLRYRVMAVDNVFFDLNNADITVNAGACYPNCDGSTGSPALTPADFVCFLNRFRAGDSYANCDGSTGSPALTPADFVCFLNAFRAGC